MSLERDVERPVVDWLRSIGCVVLKLNLIGSTGWPDRLILAPGGRVFFVEFKRPGERLRRNQPHRVALLRSLGFFVGVYDNVAEAKKELGAALLSEGGP